MTSDEERLLDLLEKKKLEDAQPNEQRGVLRLIPGRSTTPAAVEKIRELLKIAESFDEVVLVGLQGSNAQVIWSGGPSLAMLGALSRALNILAR
jgi:hypothetical protein